jgi:ABC-type anion transport system duplicated permease subunit
MGFKLVLNVLYTIGIVLCAFVAYQQYNAKNYTYMAIAIFAMALVIIFKIRLLKDVREAQKKM